MPSVDEFRIGFARLIVLRLKSSLRLFSPVRLLSIYTLFESGHCLSKGLRMATELD